MVIFIFGKERPPAVVPSGEATSSAVRSQLSPGEQAEEAVGEQELKSEENLKSWSLPDLPQCLGRIAKYLMSNNRKLRLKGIQVLHRRFWHAKLHTMLTLLERGGVDVSKKEIEEVIKACPVCRDWQLPPPNPKIKTSLPLKFNEVVDVYFMFYKNESVCVCVYR